MTSKTSTIDPKDPKDPKETGSSQNWITTNSWKLGHGVFGSVYLVRNKKGHFGSFKRVMSFTFKCQIHDWLYNGYIERNSHIQSST